MADDPVQPIPLTNLSVQSRPADLDVGEEARTKQERILDAALTLFATRGYQATAVPEIAKAAGIATGTIYRYFDTKDDLLNVLYRHWKGEFNARVFAATPEGLPARDVFSVIWRRIMDWVLACPQQAVFLDQHYHKPFLDETSQACERVYVDAFHGLVADGIAAGQIRHMPPALVAALVWGTATGMARLAGDGHIAIDEATIAQAEASLWDAIKA